MSTSVWLAFAASYVVQQPRASVRADSQANP